MRKKKTKKKYLYILLCIFSLLFGVYFFRGSYILDTLGFHYELPFSKKITVPTTYTSSDQNKNGISDAIDIVNAARVEATNKTKYESNYYEGGFPPDNEGVCTDVVWRALKGINVDLKQLMDQDIKENITTYPRVAGKPDPHIDFRRVPNQDVFFKRTIESLTTELFPYDIDNLKQWQPGDIVVFLGDFDHVGIVSDKQARDGTPYFIHNIPPFAAEIKLTSISKPIYAHYRWNYERKN